MLLSHMISYFLRAVAVGQHYDGWLNALIDEALAVGRWHNHHAWQAFLWKTIDTVVVVLVVHPEFEGCEVSWFARWRRLQLHLDWWI